MIFTIRQLKLPPKNAQKFVYEIILDFVKLTTNINYDMDSFPIFKKMHNILQNEHVIVSTLLIQVLNFQVEFRFSFRSRDQDDLFRVFGHYQFWS